MLAVRQRAAYIVQRGARPATTTTTISTLRQSTRSYASDHGHGDHHHDHHHAPQVAESPGSALYITLGVVGLSIATYSVSRDENSSLAKWIGSLTSESVNTWDQRNTLRTEIAERAAVDRNLFLSSGNRGGFELRTPELFGSGSPNNVPAGHYVNLDKVTEHYRKQHLDEEERKAKRLAEAKD